MLKRVFLCFAAICVLPLFGFAAGPDGTEETPAVNVPIVMYHSITNVNNNDYALSPAKLKADLAYLTDRGYKTVFVRDLVAYAEGRGTLPEKPVVLSFDDGFYNNYSFAMPILKEFDAVASFCVVGKYAAREEGVEKRSTVYSYINLSEISDMRQSGRAEFGNHTFNMHSYKNGRKGVRRNPGESAEAYRKALTADVKKNEELYAKAGVRFDLFAYPYGFYSKETPEILRELGYKAILTCTEGINRIAKGDTETLLYLKRYNRPSRYTSGQFFKKVCKLEEKTMKKETKKEERGRAAISTEIFAARRGV